MIFSIHFEIIIKRKNFVSDYEKKTFRRDLVVAEKSQQASLGLS